jgi:hypothetical protein
MKKLTALLGLLIILWVLLAGSSVQAQTPVEYSVLAINTCTNPDTYTVMEVSTAYAGLNISILQDRVLNSVEKLPSTSALPDYMAIYGIFGFKLETTFEIQTIVFMVFSRPITIPAQTTGA